MNIVSLTGRLTKDPEIHKTSAGTSWTNFTLAVNRRFKAEGQPDADFINCVAWAKTAETMAQHLHKGSLIGIQGRLQTRNYENQQGQRVYVTEVVADNFDFLESKNAENRPAENPYTQPQQTPSYGQPTQTYQRSQPEPRYMTSNRTDTTQGVHDSMYNDLPF